MALNNTILKLEQSGDLISLFRDGFISWRLMRDKDIYLTYSTNYTTNGNKKTKAVQDTAVQWKISDDYVWKTIKRMEQK